MKATPKSRTRTAAPDDTSGGFMEKGRAAMQERAKEIKATRGAARGRHSDQEDGESAVLAKIAEMLEPDRRLGERLHGIMKAAAPDLAVRLWYGMPTYAKNGNVICFFQPADA